jgi:hypothetical protein
LCSKNAKYFYVQKLGIGNYVWVATNLVRKLVQGVRKATKLD